MLQKLSTFPGVLPFSAVTSAAELAPRRPQGARGDAAGEGSSDRSAEG